MIIVANRYAGMTTWTRASTTNLNYMSRASTKQNRLFTIMNGYVANHRGLLMGVSKSMNDYLPLINDVMTGS